MPGRDYPWGPGTVHNGWVLFMRPGTAHIGRDYPWGPGTVHNGWVLFMRPGTAHIVHNGWVLFMRPGTVLRKVMISDM
jgi:hypothetical protein